MLKYRLLEHIPMTGELQEYQVVNEIIDRLNLLINDLVDKQIKFTDLVDQLDSIYKEIEDINVSKIPALQTELNAIITKWFAAVNEKLQEEYIPAVVEQLDKTNIEKSISQMQLDLNSYYNDLTELINSGNNTIDNDTEKYDKIIDSALAPLDEYQDAYITDADTQLNEIYTDYSSYVVGCNFAKDSQFTGEFSKTAEITFDEPYIAVTDLSNCKISIFINPKAWDRYSDKTNIMWSYSDLRVEPDIYILQLDDQYKLVTVEYKVPSPQYFNNPNPITDKNKFSYPNWQVNGENSFPIQLKTDLKLNKNTRKVAISFRTYTYVYDYGGSTPVGVLRNSETTTSSGTVISKPAKGDVRIKISPSDDNVWLPAVEPFKNTLIEPDTIQSKIDAVNTKLSNYKTAQKTFNDGAYSAKTQTEDLAKRVKLLENEIYTFGHKAGKWRHGIIKADNSFPSGVTSYPIITVEEILNKTITDEDERSKFIDEDGTVPEDCLFVRPHIPRFLWTSGSYWIQRVPGYDDTNKLQDKIFLYMKEPMPADWGSVGVVLDIWIAEQ